MAEITWPEVTAIAAVITLAATAVSWVVRSETRALRDIVILDRETVKLRMSKVEEQLAKVENVLTMLADYRGQLRIFEERLLSQSHRTDELARRVNRWIEPSINEND